MKLLNSELPRVGVSACLLGQRVRYDGGSRPHVWIRDELPKYAQLLPFCPETGAGLTTPRPPVQLVQTGSEGIRARGVHNPELDVSRQLLHWSVAQKEMLQSLEALIFKSRSPSCGLGSVPVFGSAGEIVESEGNGVFAHWVISHCPHIYVCEDVFLDEEPNKMRFLARILEKIV